MQQVILAAGKGSRLKIDTTNKCLIDLCGRKLIDYNLDLGVQIGVSKIIIIVGYNRDYIVDYIGCSYRNIPIEYIVQEPQMGIAHGIMVASSKITETFFMCLGDEILINPNLFRFLEFFERNNADCVCGTVIDCQENIRKTYTLKTSIDNRILQIIEKPNVPFNDLRGTGYCMMSKQMTNCLKDLEINHKRNEYEMGDWIQLAINNHCNCFSFNIGEATFNINENVDLKAAEKCLMLQRS